MADKSLDEVIKETNANRRRPAPRKPAAAPAAAAHVRGGERAPRERPAPYARPSVPRGNIDAPWTHDMFAASAGAPAAAVYAYGGHAFAAQPVAAQPTQQLFTGGKLLISNLDHGVSNEDIAELFQKFGKIKNSTVHYDRNGRSQGTAEVTYHRRADAVKAMTEYNGVQLDGKPMKIEITSSVAVVEAPVAAPQPAYFARPQAAPFVPGQGPRGAPRAAPRAPRAAVAAAPAAAAPAAPKPKPAPKLVAPKAKPAPKVVKTAAELDAELEAYHQAKAAKAASA